MPKYIVLMIVILTNNIFSNNISDSNFVINGKYNGYNILVAYDSVSVNCNQYGAWHALNGKSNLKNMKNYEINEELNLIVECFSPMNEYQFILDRTNSVRGSEEISRFHIYTLDDFEKNMAMKKEEKSRTEWWAAAVIVMIPVSLILGVYIIANLPL